MRKQIYDTIKAETLIQGMLRQSKSSEAIHPRKTSKLIIYVPVPRTNTGGQGENPKVSEITMVKELGKMTP